MIFLRMLPLDWLATLRSSRACPSIYHAVSRMACRRPAEDEEKAKPLKVAYRLLRRQKPTVPTHFVRWLACLYSVLLIS